MAHQDYATFTSFQADAESNKILLATIEYSQVLSGCVSHTTSIHRVNVALHAKSDTLVNLTQSLTTYVQKDSLGGLSSNNDAFYDKENERMYIFQVTTATAIDNVHVFTRRHHVATEPITAHDIPNSTGSEIVYYEPRLNSVSPFTQDRGDPFNSVNIHSKGNLSLTKADGFYDNLLDQAFFENNEVKIYASSKQLTLGNELFLGNGKVFNVNQNDKIINLGFEDLFEFINKLNIPIVPNTTRIDRFRNPALITNPFGAGDYEPISKNKTPRYLYGRMINVKPFNVQYLDENPTGGAASPLANRSWNFSDHTLKGVRTSITSVDSDTIFVAADTTGMTVGAEIHVLNLGATTTAHSTISAIDGGGTITVATAFSTGGLAVNDVVIQSSMQNLILGGTLVIPGLYSFVDNPSLGGLDTANTTSMQLRLGTVQNSPEQRQSLTIFKPDSDLLFAELVHGKPSITTNGDPTSYTLTANLLEWPGEIMLDLFINVLSLSSDQINTASFLSADAIRPVEIGLVIPETRDETTQKLITVMEKVQKSALGQYRIGRTGKLEYFVWDTITANQDILTTVVIPLTDNDFLSYKEFTNIDKLNQELRLFYRFDEVGDNFNQISQINSEAAYLFPQSQKTKEIKTLIYASSTAESISALYKDIYARPHKIIKCKVKAQTVDLFIGDRILIEKNRKIQDIFQGVWTSIGASSIGASTEFERSRHGYWTNTDGSLTLPTGSSVFNASIWQSDPAVPIRRDFTTTSELFEVISITKDGFTTEMELTNWGGSIIRSTTTAQLGQ